MREISLHTRPVVGIVKGKVTLFTAKVSKHVVGKAEEGLTEGTHVWNNKVVSDIEEIIVHRGTRDTGCKDLA